MGKVIRKSISRNGVLIGLSEERWVHIIEHHDDLAEYADEENPTAETLLEGKSYVPRYYRI